MGLDQYLTAKTNILSKTKITGACGGLIPLAPITSGDAELGYWRKAYSLQDYMWRTLGLDEDSNCEETEIDYDTVCDIVDEANKRLEKGDFEDDYDFDSWLKAKNSFEKAKWILENDKDAEIYYVEWW